MTRKFRLHALSCTAFLGLFPALAHAQTRDPSNGSNATVGVDTEIVVTGTRILQDGFRAPTPVNVLSAAEIEAQRPANITDMVYSLPSVTTNTPNAVTGAGNISSGDAGINAINLRGIGAARTLVLLDGHRTVGSTFSGLVDVNTFPQELIERVDVVTGGASAHYGSDAVGGVVNFILNKNFKGIKLGADQGITTYGDGRSYRFTATAGLSLYDDRLRILLNGEYFKQEGVDTVNRPWNNSGYQMINNPAYEPGNGQPEYFVGPGIGFASRTRGGIIDSGPLRGTYFLGDGITGQLNYGITNQRSAPWMIGGDWRVTSAGAVGTATLIPHEQRSGLFSRVSFDVTPDVTVYGQFSWNRYDGQGHFGVDLVTPIIQADNAYLLTQYPQVAAAMQSNGLSSVPVGHFAPYFPGSDNSREVFRYIAGATGRFAPFDRPWSWDIYLQRGVTKTHEQAVNSANVDRLDLATDAVLSGNQIVCRSALANPSSDCVPMDWLGTGAPSATSLAYIFGPEQPWRKQTITQDVAAASLSGELFDLPAGPVAIALGGEWHREKVNGTVAPRIGSGFWYGNYRANRGELEVKEAFLELGVPLLEGLDINAAARYADYSTTGGVTTWKVGATYSPLPDVKFRGTYSHDIRAPNLQELFNAGTSSRFAVLLPPNSPTPGPVTVINFVRGNPNLRAETANTWTLGVVATPSFLPGFSASFDYYDIDLTNAIGTVSSQQSVDFCYSGIGEFCENLVFANGQLQTVFNQPVNFGRQHVRGFDIEASYRTSLSAISDGAPGNINIHAALTHTIENVIDNRVSPRDLAGVNGDAIYFPSAIPSWRFRVSAFYELDPFIINAVARGFSSGVYSNEWTECASNCSASTLHNRTININNIDGAVYFDGSIGVKIKAMGADSRLNFIVTNIFNKAPVLVGLDRSGDGVMMPQTARPLYDTFGRIFRVALTSKF